MIISLWGGIKIRDNLTSCSWANLGTGTIRGVGTGEASEAWASLEIRG